MVRGLFSRVNTQRDAGSVCARGASVERVLGLRWRIWHTVREGCASVLTVVSREPDRGPRSRGSRATADPTPHPRAE